MPPAVSRQTNRSASTHAGVARTSPPLVAGVGGGVGATTIATALGGVDRGVFTGRAVDILACRATGDSLLRAARAAQLVVADGRPRPVLAVTATDGAGPSRPVTARLRLLEPHAEAVVILPFVRRWRELTVPLDEVRNLLTRPPTDLPRPLRRYAAAMRELRSVVPVGTPTRTGPTRAAPTPTTRRNDPRCAL